MFSSSNNSMPFKQLALFTELDSMTGGEVALEEPFVHAVLLGALSSTAMVVLSK
jgi:hypothetical protein